MQAFPEIEIRDNSLETIVAKVMEGVRLTFEDGMLLETTPDFHLVCSLADIVRKRLHGKRTGYILNVHIDYTNVCVSRCAFCAFFRNPDDPGAYVLSPEQALDRVPSDVDEIHIVGGINPDLDLTYYRDLIGTLHAEFPDAAIKALTAVEIKALSDRENLTVSELLSILKLTGLSMLPGGGAEIFYPAVREKICPVKATADEWLDIHRTAHSLGISTNSTMLHGHIEKPGHRIDHLLRLRQLQDETSGIIAHIPLPYLPSSNSLSGAATHRNGLLDLRQVAIARLMLDNIPHIKAYWRALGLRLAQVALNAGADDIDGTVGREDVMHEAGSIAPRSIDHDHIMTIITNAGLEPFRRDAFHNPAREVVL